MMMDKFRIIEWDGEKWVNIREILGWLFDRIVMLNLLSSC